MLPQGGNRNKRVYRLRFQESSSPTALSFTAKSRIPSLTPAKPFLLFVAAAKHGHFEMPPDEQHEPHEGQHRRTEPQQHRPHHAQVIRQPVVVDTVPTQNRQHRAGRDTARRECRRRG